MFKVSDKKHTKSVLVPTEKMKGILGFSNQFFCISIFWRENSNTNAHTSNSKRTWSLGTQCLNIWVHNSHIVSHNETFLLMTQSSKIPPKSAILGSKYYILLWSYKRYKNVAIFLHFQITFACITCCVLAILTNQI